MTSYSRNWPDVAQDGFDWNRSGKQEGPAPYSAWVCEGNKRAVARHEPAELNSWDKMLRRNEDRENIFFYVRSWQPYPVGLPSPLVIPFYIRYKATNAYVVIRV